MDKQKIKKRFWRKVDKSRDCWMWTASCNGKGYGQLWVINKLRIATHVAWFLETGAWPDDRVLHRCDTPQCVRFSHLFEGTNHDNTQDMIAKGRMPRGADRPHAKLVDSDVREIRRRLSLGHIQREIAVDYGVAQGQISAINTGRGWSHIA